MPETPITPRYTSTCPRCDKEYAAPTQKEAYDLVAEHLKIQEDEVHEGAYETWVGIYE